MVDLFILIFLIFAVIVIVKITNQSSQLEKIEWFIKNLPNLTRRVEELESEIQLLKKGTSSREKSDVPKKEVIKEQKPVTTISPVIQPVPSFTNPAPKITAELPPSRTREEWESLIGGKLMNRIGSLALIIGVGFFLKYAFDNNWISETVRVLIGAAFGFASVAGGYSTHKRGLKIFAQGLVGAGISILYLSVYASFNYYHLVPQWAAFGMMLIITAFTFANGLYYDSLAVALLGWAGGFLTPLLLSTGDANEIGLFSYIAFLDSGIAALIVKKERWNVLEPLTLAATWLMFLAWYDKYYVVQDLGITVLFITLFWGIFLVLDIYRSRSSASMSLLTHIVPGLNAILYYATLYVLVDEVHHPWMSVITLAVAGVYLLMFLEFHRRGVLTELVRIRYTLSAAVLIVLATSIQFDDFTTVIFWSFEAAILIWCASYWKLVYLEQAALVLFGVAAFKLLFFSKGVFGYTPLNEFSLIVNLRAASFAALGLSLLYSALTTKKWKEGTQNELSNGLQYAWIVTFFLLMTIETNDLYRFKELNAGEPEKALLGFVRLLMFSLVWMTYSIILVGIGLWKKIMPMIYSGLLVASIGMLFGTIKGIAYEPIAQFSSIVNVRFLALILLTAGLIVHARMLRSSEALMEMKNDIVGIVQVAIVIVLFVLMTGETRDYFQKEIVELDRRSVDASRLVNLQQLFLSGVWLAYSVVLMSVGIWRRFRGMRFAAISLFGITILKIFIYDLSFLETLYRIFSFMGLGIILLAVSYVYQKYKDIILGTE